MLGTYHRLNVTVHASSLTVIRAATTKLTSECRRDPAQRAARHRFYRQMLEYHAEAQALVNEFRL